MQQYQFTSMTGTTAQLYTNYLRDEVFLDPERLNNGFSVHLLVVVQIAQSFLEKHYGLNQFHLCLKRKYQSQTLDQFY